MINGGNHIREIVDKTTDRFKDLENKRLLRMMNIRIR